MSLGSMRLRLECDGSPAREYRIEDGNVEVRTPDPEGGSVRRNGKCLVAAYARATEVFTLSAILWSLRLETFIAGICGPRTEYVESCRNGEIPSSTWMRKSRKVRIVCAAD